MRFEHSKPTWMADRDIVSVATYDRERQLWVRHGATALEYQNDRAGTIARLERLNIDKLQRHNDADTAPAHTFNIP